MVSGDVIGPVTVAISRFAIRVATDPPQMLSHYLAHARLVDEFTTVDDRSSVGYCFVGVGVGEWPQLVVTQRFAPAGHGFAPGVLLVPETGVLFIGAGTRLLGYHIDNTGDWRRGFVDEAHFGFWGWRQHGDVVIMSAELELAAWTTSGEKLWTTIVEPPWSYDVVGHDVRLDVMGTRSAFGKHTGPPTKP